MKGGKRVITNEMGAGKEYGERDWEKRNRAGEEKEERRELRENRRGKGLGEGREDGEMKKVQAIRMGERVKLERRD